MVFDKLLDNLTLDAWYKVVVYLSSIIIILAIFLPTQSISTNQILKLFGGLWCIGLGEWSFWGNIVRQIAFSGDVGVFKNRKSNLTGITLYAVGLFLLLWFAMTEISPIALYFLKV